MNYGSIEITDKCGVIYLINLEDYSYIVKFDDYYCIHLKSNKEIDITNKTYKEIKEIVCDS